MRSFSKWNERDECFFIKLKRINNIHRATAVACDYKGRNFAVIQAHPKSNVIDVPQLSPSEMASHMMTLFREADLYDDVHDAVIKVRTMFLSSEVISIKIEPLTHYDLFFIYRLVSEIFLFISIS